MDFNVNILLSWFDANKEILAGVGGLLGALGGLLAASAAIFSAYFAYKIYKRECYLDQTHVEVIPNVGAVANRTIHGNAIVIKVINKSRFSITVNSVGFSTRKFRRRILFLLPESFMLECNLPSKIEPYHSADFIIRDDIIRNQKDNPNFKNLKYIYAYCGLTNDEVFYGTTNNFKQYALEQYQQLKG